MADPDPRDAEYKLAGCAVVPAAARHYRWDRRLPPALTIASGESVRVEVLAGDRRFRSRDAVEAELASPGRGPDAMTLSGPIAIRDARAGDLIRIELMNLELDPFGYTRVEPGVGLLGDEIDEALVHVWSLAGSHAEFRNGIRVPMVPFLGVVGLAPRGKPRGTRAPGRHGGNLDVKLITVGATLWLRVDTDGALVSVGDAHAAQGDGEVCGTAIETSGIATLRLTIEQRELPALAYRTPCARPPTGDEAYCGLGIGSDLWLAAKDATRTVLEYLVTERGLSRSEGYALTSVAADLRINELVDDPNWVVSCCLPLSIFEDAQLGQP